MTICEHCNTQESVATVEQWTDGYQSVWRVCADCSPAVSEFATLTFDPAYIDRDPLACRVRWHDRCVVVTDPDGTVRHEHADRCPACGFSYYWANTSPGTCDGCGYPTTHKDE